MPKKTSQTAIGKAPGTPSAKNVWLVMKPVRSRRPSGKSARSRSCPTQVKPIRLSTEASDELVETVAFYEPQRAGLGAAFLSEFEKSTQLIPQFPQAGRALGQRFRRVLTKRFPYAVIYIERDTEFFIVAIAHTSRRWQLERAKSISVVPSAYFLPQICSKKPLLSISSR